MTRFASILETIGRTPLVRLSRLAPSHVEIYAKVESFNPMGSVKDRMAMALIDAAERSGELQPGQTVIDATSGNTGIALAMVCARKGYPLVVTMAENFSVERRRLLRFLGARVVLTPAAQKGSGMLRKAEELAREHGYFLCRQFENPFNASVHADTTAKEIIEDFRGDTLHYWVSGFGTGGTVNGVATALRRAGLGTRVVVAEPDNAALMSSGLAQPRDAGGRMTASHPHFRPHLMQGWSPDFMSPLAESALREGLIDEIVPVSGHDALRWSRELARTEGILCGISSGATFAAALAVAERAAPGSKLVCMLPDTGERYLSTPLFEDIDAAMDEAEWQLSRSTPACRFDTPAVVPSTAVLASAVAQDRDPVAVRFVQQAVTDHTVVMFALTWCEFCWSVRRFLERAGVRHQVINLDAVALQADDLGARIRTELQRQTGAATIPQIFIAGQPIGGCTDLFDAWRAGSVQAQLADAGVPCKPDALDPYSFLPAWLQPRQTAA